MVNWDLSSIETPFDDPAPGIRFGDFVQAREDLQDEDISSVPKGMTGEVIMKHFDSELGWCLPTVRFENGAVLCVTPEEVDVLAPADFATREETTPKKPVREPIRRGLM